MNALIVAGTRPEAIKLWSVREATGAHVLWTSQHEEQEVLPPDEVIPWDARLGELPFDMTPYDVVLVQGDTFSAYRGALTAFMQRVPVAHVEAGLRTGCIHEPFPEEALRRMIAPLTTWHFTPTPAASAALRAEGYSAVHHVGNPVVDAAWAFRKASALARAPFVLATVHRRENRPHLREILDALALLARDVRVVLPVHPSVRDVVLDYLEASDVELVAPQPYGETLDLIARAAFIITDSGGIQEEAPIFGTPLIVTRNVTERPEGVRAGIARLVGPSKERIVRTARRLLRYPPPKTPMTLYGDGTAGKQIARILTQEYA